jgi:predicted RNA-binding protein with PIN domain
MSTFSGAWPRILSEVISVARAVLRELEGPEVPATLHKVAGTQGGQLPPPLAVALLREVDSNDWLREKVATEWDGEEGDAADLFLRRPGGWWLELAAMADAADQGEQQSRIADLEAKLEEIDAKRAAAVKRSKETRKAAEAASRESRESVEAAKKAVEQRYSAEVAAATSLRAEVESAEEQRQQRESEHLELQDAFDALRSRFAKARRGRFEDTSSVSGSRSFPADPVKLARMLDRQARELGRDLSEPPAPPQVRKARLTLANGIRPDSSDAIRWLIGLDRPAVVLVDGYNAQFHIDRADFTSGAARRRLVDALKRLRSSADTNHRVVVVYDSMLPGDRSARTSAGGVEIRFAEKDRIADEELVEMAGRLDNAVVISSDRAVRDGAEANGAVVLWSESLASWLTRS